MRDNLFVLLWGFLVAGFAVLEIGGLKDDDDNWPTFTDLVRKYIPRWITALVLVWLSYHFLIEDKL